MTEIAWRPLHLARRLVDIDQPPPTLDWIAPNIAASGFLTILAGEGGVGKTSLAVQIAAGVGDRHFGRAAILSAENVSALRLLTESMGIGSESLAVLGGGGIDLSREPDRIGLVIEVLRAGGLELLVLDSLSTFAPGRDVNSAADMSDYILGLQKAAEHMRCAILLVHHFNKSGSSTGSAAIRDRADFTLGLVQTAEREVLKVVPDKWKLGRRPEPWHMRRVEPDEDEVLRFEHVDGLAPTLAADMRSDLLGLPSGTYSTGDLRATLGLDGGARDRKRLSEALKGLLIERQFEQVQRGEYRRL